MRKKGGRRGQRRSVAVKEIACVRREEGEVTTSQGGFGFRAQNWSGEAGRRTLEVLVSEPKESSHLTIHDSESWKLLHQVAQSG